MVKRIFYIDMDNTTNDFTTHYVNFYNKIYNKNIELKRDDLIRYHLASLFPNLTKQEASAVRNNIFSIKEFWQELPVFENAVEVLRKMQQVGHEILFVSAPWPAYLDCGKDKLLWVEKNFPFIPITNVIFTHHKYLLQTKNAIMFDDSPDYLKKFKGIKVAMNYPFNQHIGVDARVNNWKEFEQYLQEIGVL